MGLGWVASGRRVFCFVSFCGTEGQTVMNFNCLEYINTDRVLIFPFTPIYLFLPVFQAFTFSIISTSCKHQALKKASSNSPQVNPTCTPQTPNMPPGGASRGRGGKFSKPQRGGNQIPLYSPRLPSSNISLRWEAL